MVYVLLYHCQKLILPSLVRIKLAVVWLTFSGSKYNKSMGTLGTNAADIHTPLHLLFLQIDKIKHYTMLRLANIHSDRGVVWKRGI